MFVWRSERSQLQWLYHVVTGGTVVLRYVCMAV